MVLRSVGVLRIVCDAGSSARKGVVANKLIVGLRRWKMGGGVAGRKRWRDEDVVVGCTAVDSVQSGYLAEDKPVITCCTYGSNLVDCRCKYARSGGSRREVPANETRRMPRDERLKPWPRDSAGPNSVLADAASKSRQLFLFLAASLTACRVPMKKEW